MCIERTINSDRLYTTGKLNGIRNRNAFAIKKQDLFIYYIDPGEII